MEVFIGDLVWCRGRGGNSGGGAEVPASDHLQVGSRRDIEKVERSSLAVGDIHRENSVGAFVHDGRRVPGSNPEIRHVGGKLDDFEFPILPDVFRLMHDPPNYTSFTWARIETIAPPDTL